MDSPSPSRSVVLEKWNRWIARREIVLALAAVGIFFLLNLSIASRSPFGGWMDETCYVDPGLNLATGKGWTSTAWTFQTDREFWAMNSPLYPGALYPWARAFGVSMIACRAYCYFLGALGTAFFWLAAFRFKFVNPAGRLFWVVLLSTEYSTNWMMRNERYDVWIFLGLGLALLGASLMGATGRYGLIFVGCLLGPVAGFVCIPYIFTMAALVACLTAFRRWKEALVAMLGTVCGVGAVFAFYYWAGALGNFVRILRSHTALNANAASLGVHASKWQVFLYPREDYGVILMIAALLLLTLACWRNRDTASRRWMWLGWGTVFLVPCIMLLRASFGMMYFYMVIIPLSLSIFSLLTLHQSANRRRWSVAAVVVALLGVTCLTGLPARLYTTFKEWNFRDPQHLQDFVHRHITPDDRVLTDSTFYFVLRDHVRFCAESHYIGGIPPDEATNLNVLILPVSRFPDLTRDVSGLENIGEGWKKIAVFPTGEMLSNLKHSPHSTESFVLYRR